MAILEGSYDRKKGIDACTDLDYTVNEWMEGKFGRKLLNPTGWRSRCVRKRKK